MGSALLLIDGENFIYKVEEVLKSEALDKSGFDIQSIRLTTLIKTVFEEYANTTIEDVRFYSAKLNVHPDTETKSRILIQKQRKLKTNLERQGVKFIVAGQVRAYGTGGVSLVFKEKGVDVRIAVDMITTACDKTYDTIILCSSDSDLQPAVKESMKRGTKIIYLGFSMNPNKGLTYTTNQTVLFRNPEIVDSVRITKAF